MQRRRARLKRKHRLGFTEYPEIRLTNSWCVMAGFEPGDVVSIDSPEYGTLVVMLHRRAQPEDVQGYIPNKPLKPLT